MNIKHRPAALLSASAVILVSALAVNLTGNAFWANAGGININCVSTLSLPELPGGRKFNGSVIVQLHKNNSGEVDFSGVMSEPSGTGEKSWRQLDVQRSITFDYQLTEDGLVKLYETRTSKKSVDAIPDEIFSAYIYDSSEAEKRMRIARLHNGYLIGNTFSPSSLCISKS